MSPAFPSEAQRADNVGCGCGDTDDLTTADFDSGIDSGAQCVLGGSTDRIFNISAFVTPVGRGAGRFGYINGGVESGDDDSAESGDDDSAESGDDDSDNGNDASDDSDSDDSSETDSGESDSDESDSDESDDDGSESDDDGSESDDSSESDDDIEGDDDSDGDNNNIAGGSEADGRAAFLAFIGGRRKTRDDVPDDGEYRAPGATEAAVASADGRAALQSTTNTSECSEAAGRAPGEPCSSPRVLVAIGEFVVSKKKAGGPAPPPTAAVKKAAETVLPDAPTPEANAVRAAAQVLGCGSESCVIKHPDFRSYAAAGALRDAGGARALDAELARQFKPEGPRASTQLLSNFNIDSVLQEWAVTHPKFFNYSFNMIDFESTGGTLARTDVAGILEGYEPQSLGPAGGVVKRPCDTFACVLNTDISSGRGKHWVAIFGDCRGQGEWSVEYFNSAGNPPPGPAARWLEEAAARLASHRASHPDKYGTGAVISVPVTDARHQNSMTECGLYALYYIRRRLEGAPYAEFRGTRIPDSAMVEFRKHVFRAEG